MNDPERLADGHGSELVKTMLHAARDDSPSDAALQRTLMALGTGAAVLGASASVTGAAAVGGASGGGSSAGTVIGASSVAVATQAGGLGLLTVKWVGIGVMGGLLTAGVADRIRAHDTPAAVPAVAPALPAATPTVVAPLAAEEMHEARLPVAAVDDGKERNDRAAAVKTDKADKPRADSRAPLAAEVAAVDRAREAMTKGDADRALRELDAYARQFGEQRLAPEALYLRMEALMRRGDLKGARASANQLIATDPNGPHASRARAVLSSPVAP